MRRLITRLHSTDKPTTNKSGTDKPVIGKTTAPAALPGLWRRIKISLYSLAAIAAVASFGMALADRDQVTGDILAITARAGLTLEQIQVRGRAHTPQDKLVTALGLTVGQPILGIDLVAIHDRIRHIGWVEQATVERRLPSTIHVTIRERVPVALLQTDSDHQLIDQSGTIITGADPREFSHLRVVAGDGAANKAAQILAILKTEPELFAAVWAVSFRAKRRWDVHLKNGIDIRLPETDPISAWSRLAILDRTKQITNRDLAVIDLRVPHQLVVEPNIPVRGQGRRT
ncbi:MAG: FtsQ-type POTRA domain-containing protein [Candidatus Puniceispirillum sp.]